ncbi:hypothetical protein ACFQZC_00910 [Streptacidiphilus monticola]
MDSYRATASAPNSSEESFIAIGGVSLPPDQADPVSACPPLRAKARRPYSRLTHYHGVRAVAAYTGLELRDASDHLHTEASRTGYLGVREDADLAEQLADWVEQQHKAATRDLRSALRERATSGTRPGAGAIAVHHPCADVPAARAELPGGQDEIRTLTQPPQVRTMDGGTPSRGCRSPPRPPPQAGRASWWCAP